MSTRTATSKVDAGTTFPTRNDLPAENRTKLISLLNQQVADTFDLMSQTKFAHWNVKGPQFIALHKLFDTLAHRFDLGDRRVVSRAETLIQVAQLGLRRRQALSEFGRLPRRDVVKRITDEAHDPPSQEHHPGCGRQQTGGAIGRWGVLRGRSRGAGTHGWTFFDVSELFAMGDGETGKEHLC